jgi:DNA-binding response OmpR family regulator
VSRTRGVYASQLRMNLADDPDRPRLVTEPGAGYPLAEPVSPPEAPMPGRPG